jgi:hypothetical protein
VPKIFPESLGTKSACSKTASERKTLAGQQTLAIKTLEEQLTEKNEVLQEVLQDGQELLSKRDAEIADLKSQLQRLMRGIDQMSSFFRQAQALTEIGEHQINASVQNDTAREAELKPAAVQSELDQAPAAEAQPQIVAPQIFERIIQELAQASNIMDKLASLIVHDHVKALGETVERFPKARLPELIEALARDISEENRQTAFRQRAAGRAELTLH